MKIKIAKIIFSVVLLMPSAFSYSQSVVPDIISSDGGFQTSSAGSVSYTLGEPVSETAVSGTYILTQGFQQPNIFTTVNVPDDLSEGKIFVFPNPVSNFVTLDFSNMNLGSYSFFIYDEEGKLLLSSEVNIDSNLMQQKISMENYCVGVYLFKLIECKSKSTKSFKIIKQK